MRPHLIWLTACCEIPNSAAISRCRPVRFLVASTFILGYGIGAALGPAYHSNEARLLGAGIAALNGTLLLSFALQYVRLYLLSDANEESLDDSYVSQFLLDQVGWILMITAIIAVPVLLFSALPAVARVEV